MHLMYIARFSYEVLPVNRQRAIDFIRQEVEAARINGLNSRLLVPFTRGPSGPALQFEIELTSLDELDRFRSRGLGSSEETAQLFIPSARSYSSRPASRFCESRSEAPSCSFRGWEATSFLMVARRDRTAPAG